MIKELKFYGADWCPDCRRAKSFLRDNNIEFEYIDVDLDQEATLIVEKINGGKRIIPTLEIQGKTLSNPNNGILASVLGINDVGRVILYGADWCPDCRRAKTYLADNHINFQFIDVDEHEFATAKVESINHGKRIIPTILINGKPYSNPDNAILRNVLKIDEQKEEKFYDSIIVGGGAAGLTTAIYAQRDRFDTLILESKTIGGNAFLTEKIENYPGFTSISGPALMDKMADQALTYGATIKTGEEVVDIKKDGGHFIVKTKYNQFTAKSVVLATGSTYQKLNIPGEDELIGSAVHFCATCDGAFYRDKEVIVIGGGNSALEEGIFLSGFTKKVKIINRNAQFKGSKTYTDKLPDVKNIEVWHNREAIEFKLDEKGGFAGLLVRDRSTGAEELILANGVFIFIGLVPNNQSFEGLVDMNTSGFITTTGLAKTSVPGIFAAGDNREGAIAQVAAATGEGVLASYGLREYLH
ncbi:MAG: FAD-dependent oxidoreductase [Saprospiraceae bacterium]|nr:FAD-dependent oxidoreductase [Saprospiraceae bacterium]